VCAAVSSGICQERAEVDRAATDGIAIAADVFGGAMTVQRSAGNLVGDRPEGTTKELEALSNILLKPTK